LWFKVATVVFALPQMTWTQADEKKLETHLQSSSEVFFLFGVGYFLFNVYRPGGQVERYLECMGRLVEAITFFSQNNPDSPELNTVVRVGSNFFCRFQFLN